jgi:hypothetical protein
MIDGTAEARGRRHGQQKGAVNNGLSNRILDARHLERNGVRFRRRHCFHQLLELLYAAQLFDDIEDFGHMLEGTNISPKEGKPPMDGFFSDWTLT